MVVPFVYTEEEYKKLEEENKRLKEAFEIADMCVNNTVNENKKLNDLNSELRRINNKIMDKLEQKTRLVNYYRREKRKLKSDLNLVIDERDNAFKKIEQLKEELGKFIMKH